MQDLARSSEEIVHAGADAHRNPRHVRLQRKHLATQCIGNTRRVHEATLWTGWYDDQLLGGGLGGAMGSRARGGVTQGNEIEDGVPITVNASRGAGVAVAEKVHRSSAEQQYEREAEIPTTVSFDVVATARRAA